MGLAERRVTVVIPNWNGERHLRECLDSLRAQTCRDFSVTLVDNGSEDGGVRLVRDAYPEVAVIETGSNLGFAGAVNAGIRSSKAEFVALLNNDTRADEAWIAELVAAADRHPEADSFASLMVFHSDTDLVNAAGDDFVIGLASAVNRGMHARAAEYREPAWVFGACAGAAMYRRSFFDAVGLFDEQYFLIHEDTDLNMRGQLAARRCLYVPRAIVAHKLGATIGTMPSRSSLALALRNQALVLAKTLPWPVLLLELPVMVWRDVRDTLPLRPSRWSRIPHLLGLVPLRCAARWSGLLMGLRSRGAVPRRETGVGALVRGFRARPLGPGAAGGPASR